MKFTTALIVGCAFAGGSFLALAEDQAESEKKSRLDEATEKVEADVKNIEQDVKKVFEGGKKAFLDMIDQDSVTVNFDRGSASLSDAEKAALRAAVTAARSDAKLKRVVVAAWSDSDLPRSNDVKLSAAERKLADKRGEQIHTYLKTLDVGKIATYSMAEHANWFQRMFKTDEAEIKKSMQGLEINNETERMLADKLVAKGGPSRAAVIIITENSYLSH
jgi:outer membrane protein OmpA-like peptidoglycan-associated protein